MKRWVLISSFLFSGILPALSARLDSLKKLPDDTGKVDQLNQLSRQFEINADYDSGISCARLALDIGLKLGYSRGVADAYNVIGNNMLAKGNFAEAESYYLKSLPIRTQLLDEARKSGHSKTLKDAMKGVTVVYNNLGVTHASRGNYPEAIKSYLASLRMKEELLALAVKERDSAQTAILNKSIATSYNNIANTYFLQDDYTAAMKYYQSALELRKKINDKRGVAQTLDGIGGILDNQKKYGEGLKNHLEALAIFLELGDRQSEAYCRQQIGINYKMLGDVKRSLEQHLLALEIEKEIGDRQGISISYTNLGQLYLLQQKIGEAKEYFQLALPLIKETGSKNDLKFCYQGLSSADSAEGNFAQALKHYKLFIAYRDSLVNEENTKKTVQTQMQYEFDKQQAADSVQNAERLKQEEIRHEQEIGQQRLYTVGGVIGFLLMLVVAGVSFNAYRQKQKANLIISEQKQLVEMKQKEILDSIYYARRIQQSLMPTGRYIERVLEQLNRN